MPRLGLDRGVGVPQGDDRGDLDRLEQAVVVIALDDAQGPHHLRVAAAEADPPAGHVVALAHRGELDAHLLRPRRGQEARRLIAVEGHAWRSRAISRRAFWPPRARDVGVEFTTMSKGYNMAGWRVGFAAATPRWCGHWRTIKTYYDYGMFQAIQIAAIVALRQCDAAVERQGEIYQARRDVLVEGLRRLGWDVTPPRAGMLCWAKVPEPWASAMRTMDFAEKLLEEGNVAVSPGSGFGPAGEGYLRLALVENENRLKQAVRQIGRCLGNEGKAAPAVPASA